MSDLPCGTVVSPCVSVCGLNEEDVCIGCYRTAEEITLWIRFNDDERQAVIRRAGERGSRLADHPKAPL